MVAASLPILSESGLSRYIEEASRFPMLGEREEYMLAKAWVEYEDVKAAHKLVTSHLRLVIKVAMGFRGYGLPTTDLIAEGNIGLMQAVKKFDPEKGFRLSTYAMWWIKASIQEYVLRSWSLVKMGTSAAQKKLFFNLRRVKNRITASDSRDLTPAEVRDVAEELDVPERDVIEMDQRLGASDPSLNSYIGDGENSAQWIDYLEDDSQNHEVAIAEKQALGHQRQMLQTAMKVLNEREQDILHKRRLAEPAVTLEELSQEYEISRERVRQIENRAIEKLQARMIEMDEPVKLLANY